MAHFTQLLFCVQVTIRTHSVFHKQFRIHPFLPLQSACLEVQAAIAPFTGKIVGQILEEERTPESEQYSERQERNADVDKGTQLPSFLKQIILLFIFNFVFAKQLLVLHSNTNVNLLW